MFIFVDVFFKQQNQFGQYQNHGQNSEHNALCHHKAEVKAQAQLHKAQRHKPEYRCQRTAD